MISLCNTDVEPLQKVHLRDDATPKELNAPHPLRASSRVLNSLVLNVMYVSSEAYTEQLTGLIPYEKSHFFAVQQAVIESRSNF